MTIQNANLSEAKKSNALDAQQNVQQNVANAGNAQAANEQKTQGLDLAHGALSETLASGESAKKGNNPYNTFNYYKSKGGLGSSYFGLIDGKGISEHTFGNLASLSKKDSTLNISYTDGDAPRTVTGRLFALGKYQIIPDTLQAAKTSLQFKDSDVFSPANQDRCFSEYLIAKKRPAVMAYLNGRGTIEAAALALAQEWASVGIQAGVKNAYGRSGASNGLTSYYAGDGVNNASISYAAIVKALEADRAAIQSGGIATRTVGDQAAANAVASTNATPAPVTNTGNVEKAAAANPAADKVAAVDIDKAVRCNKSYGYSRATWKSIQSTVGLTGSDVDGYVGKITTTKIAEWQATNNLDVDGICGPNTLAKIKSSSTVEKAPASVPASSDVQQDDNQSAQPQSGNAAAAAQAVNQNQGFKYFSLDELTHSDTAKARGIDNSIPNDEVRQNLIALIQNVLDPVREAHGSAISVNSGYRCPTLNSAVGGVSNSQHKTGQAADISVGSKTANKQLFQTIINSGVQFDQLINEYGYSWVHVSYNKNGNRMQKLNIN